MRSRRSSLPRAVALGLSLALASSSAAAAAMHGPRRPAPPLLTLLDAQAIALERHPDIKVRDFDVSAAQEAVNVAKAAYAPQVYGNAVTALAAPGTRLSAYGALNDPTVIQRGAVGIGMAQELTDFGRTADLVKAAEQDLQGQAKSRDATRDVVLLNVTEAYFEVLRADALLVVADQTQRERRTLLRQVAALQHAGLRSTLDVAIAERDVSEADQLVLQARNGRDDALARLAQAMGSSNERAYTLQDVATLPPLPPNVDALLDTAYRSNPALANLQAEVGAAQSRAAAAKQLSAPTVYAYGYLGVTPLRAANQAINPSYQALGVALNVPIFDGGALKDERRRAGDAAYAAAQAVESERNTLAGDVRVAYDGVQTAHGNIGVTQHLLSTARQALALTRARYRIGLNSIVDVSAAQLSETQAEIDRTNATYDYIVKEAALAYATGIIGTADLLTSGAAPVPTASLNTPAPGPTPPPEPKRHRRFPL
jgi:outer membrane protein